MFFEVFVALVFFAALGAFGSLVTFAFGSFAFGAAAFVTVVFALAFYMVKSVSRPILIKLSHNCAQLCN